MSVVTLDEPLASLGRAHRMNVIVAGACRVEGCPPPITDGLEKWRRYRPPEFDPGHFRAR